MPPKPPESIWHAITNFTPGIHQRLSASYPPGTASPTNTYRCYAVDGGALAPLKMRESRRIYRTPPVEPTLNQATEFRVVGLAVADPLFYGPEATPGIDQDNSEIFICTEWYSSDHLYLDVSRYRRHYKNNPVWQTVWSSPAQTNAYNPLVGPRHCEFGITRSNYNQAADHDYDSSAGLIVHGGASPKSGPTVIAWTVNGYAQFFPDDANPSALSTVAMPGDRTAAGENALIFPDTLVMHQGRAVIMPLSLTSFGPNSVYAHNETIYYTAYNNLRQSAVFSYPYPYAATADTAEQEFFTIAVGNEHPTGYQVMESLTSNELLLIKTKGGGYIIQGDVAGIGPNSPTARSLPYLRSPGISGNRGCYGPAGFVYPCDGGGVWLWQGGDFSQHISKQMLPEFWRPPSTDVAGNSVGWGFQGTSCASVNEFVTFPNNWLWDTDTQGWWRTDNPDDFTSFRWAADYRNRFMYATPSGFRDASDPAVVEYNMTLGAASYSWQSQPLVSTIETSISVLNVALVSLGAGTIDVTVSTLQEPNGITQRFYADSSTHPCVQRQSYGVRGTHITFRVESISDDPDDEAPTVLELRYETGVDLPIGR